ncbi:MAG TPA: laccase domain-containing protein, partial [Terriglobales bacterium]
MKPTILRAPTLNGIPWLIHGFSTRNGGVSRPYGGGTLNLGLTKEDSRRAVGINRAAFLKRLGAVQRGQPFLLVTLRQIHSDIIHCVGDVPSEPLVGDGIVTEHPGIVLAIQTADCLPV